MRREPAAAAIDERWPFVFCLCYVSHVTCFVSRSRREEVRVQYRVAQKDRTEEEQQGTGTGVNKSALSGSRGAFRNSRVNKHKQAHSSPFSLSRLRPLATSSSSSHLNTWLATKHKARTQLPILSTAFEQRMELAASEARSVAPGRKPRLDHFQAFNSSLGTRTST